MTRVNLRVYHGPQSEEGLPTTGQAADDSTVTVSLGEILPLLADAVTSRRTWLEDFDQDQVTISADLYEVILAYQHFRRPSA